MSRWRIASIASDDALILCYGTNLPRMRFSGMTGLPNDLVRSLPSPFWPGCITNTSECDFRKGQGFITATFGFRFSVHTGNVPTIL